MDELKQKVITYLKGYNGWIIRTKEIKDIFYEYPGSINKVITQLIGEGKLIPQPNQAFVKVRIGGRI